MGFSPPQGPDFANISFTSLSKSIKSMLDCDKLRTTHSDTCKWSVVSDYSIKNQLQAVITTWEGKVQSMSMDGLVGKTS